MCRLICCHFISCAYTTTWNEMITEWRRLIGSPELQMIFYNEPLNIGLFCGKWPIKIRDPMSFRHPVSQKDRILECHLTSRVCCGYCATHICRLICCHFISCAYNNMKWLHTEMRLLSQHYKTLCRHLTSRICREYRATSQGSLD